MMNITALHAALVAVCPIIGVSSDGRIDFDPMATTTQRDAAQAILAAWAEPAPVLIANVKALVQAMHANGWDVAFHAALSVAKPSDQMRWSSYSDVPADNPVLGRLWSAAEPSIAIATLYAATGTRAV